MKCVLLSYQMFFYCLCSFAQTEVQKFKETQFQDKHMLKMELKDQLIKNDFTKLFMQTDNSVVYGFIGENYQRLRVKFISVTEDTSLSDTYIVYGKSMVKNNICEFHGSIKITNIRKLNITQHGCEDEEKYKGFKGQFFILGDYTFSENEEQKYTGIFNGTFRSDFFIDKSNHVIYDDIENCSDSYTNNQFVGQWIGYKTKIAKRCNWGDFRVPNSGDLDIGAGEFSPDDKYLKFGWQSRRDLMISQSEKNAKEAEEAKWWK